MHASGKHPLKSSGLSRRTIAQIGFSANEFTHLEDFTTITKSKFSRIFGIGEGTVNDVLRVLRNHGLSFAPEANKNTLEELNSRLSSFIVRRNYYRKSLQELRECADSLGVGFPNGMLDEETVESILAKEHTP